MYLLVLQFLEFNGRLCHFGIFRESSELEKSMNPRLDNVESQSGPNEYEF